MASIKDFKLISDHQAQKLAEVGIRTCSQLLERASTPVDRMNLADKIGIDGSVVADLTNHADMMRVKGMTPELAVALCKTGVCTVPKLAYHSIAGLHEKLIEHTDYSVDRKTLEAMVSSAKSLPKIIRH